MLNLLILIILLAIGYGFWRYFEKRHFKEITKNESLLKDIIILSDWDLKNIEAEGWELLMWNIVVSVDYFKKFIAWLINFFWWRITTYETLLDRARRDSIVQVKRQAKEKWYNSLVNLRLETSSISRWAKNQIWSIEMFAYATACRVKL